MAEHNLPWPLMINCPDPRRERWAVIGVGLVLIPALIIVMPLYLLLEVVDALRTRSEIMTVRGK